VLRTVPDTNVVISAEYGNPGSPNKEFFSHWKNKEFELLYSDNTLKEYIVKLREFGISREDVKALIKPIIKLGVHVEIIHFHLPEYPPGPYDIAFILCAYNGKATHLIAYDKDLLNIKHNYEFSFYRHPRLQPNKSIHVRRMSAESLSGASISKRGLHYRQL